MLRILIGTRVGSYQAGGSGVIDARTRTQYEVKRAAESLEVCMRFFREAQKVNSQHTLDEESEYQSDWSEY